MYRVLLRNGATQYVIHNSSTDKITSKLVSGTINKGINTIDSFQFSILPNNIGFQRLIPYRTKIIVENLKTKKIVFHGRVLKVKPSMNNKGALTNSVVCEGRLAYLCDSIQPYTEEQKWATDETKTGLEKYIDYLLENHNRQVEAEKKIYRGRIEVPTLSKDNSVDKGTNYQTTFQVIQEKLIKVFGGEIQLRETNRKLYLDYLLQIGEEKNTNIEVTKNMKSIDEEIDYSEIFTRLIPLGAKLKIVDEQGNETETEERLTIESVNDGSLWLDTDLITSLGIITKTVNFDHINKASDLLDKAKDYIKTETVATEKHKLGVLDLSVIDSNFDELEVGNVHAIKNHLLELNKKLRIIKLTLDICKPTSSNITVGDTKQTLSDITLSRAKDVADVLQQLTYITNNYVKNTTMNQSYTKLYSLIEQEYNRISLMLQEEYVSNSDFSESLERIVQLELMIDRITFLVNEVSNLSTITTNLQLTVGEIKSEISNVTNMTDAFNGIGICNINGIAQSEIILLKIHPTKTDLACSYLEEEQYLKENQYLLGRTVSFVSSEETVFFEIPKDLYFYNEEVYDEFVLDYQNQRMYIIRRVGITSITNQKYVLSQEQIEEYDYSGIELLGGNYTVKCQSFDDVSIYIVGMINNLYTAQFPTIYQFKTQTIQTDKKIEDIAKVKVGNDVFEAYQKLTAKEFDVRVKSGEIISSINLSSEKARIKAEKIEINATDVIKILSGNAINMTTNNITFNATNFSVNKDGYVKMKNADVSGKITASSGKIGNWDILSDRISQTHTASDGKVYITTLANYNNDSANSRILHCSVDGVDTFYVYRNGKLFANNAEIQGKITATSGSFIGKITSTSGTIGGWTLTTGKIYGGTSSTGVAVMQLPSTNTTWVFAAGGTSHSAYADCPFRVSKSGDLYATKAHINGSITASSGKIADFTINGAMLVGNNVGMSGKAGQGYAFWAGSNDATNALFRVDHGGGLRAMNAEIQGKIIATSGSFTGSISSSTISGSSILGGSIKIEKTGFFAFGTGTTHPWASAINVTSLYGINFYNGTNVNNIGSQKGYIDMGGSNGALQVVSIQTDTVVAGYHVKLAAREGEVYASRNGGANYPVSTSNGNISSLSLKENLEQFNENEYEKAYNLLKKIDLYRFDYKYKISENKNEYGFIIDYIEQNEGYNQFLYFKNQKAKVLNNRELDYLVGEEDQNVIDFKKYDEENLCKYMLTVIKAMQIKIENLERRLS